MKTDNYTKAILTIIAVLLAINVLIQPSLYPNAQAEEPALVYDCDTCDELDDIDRQLDGIEKKVKSMEWSLSSIESDASSANSNAFGNMCGSCPD
jgi:hypothetical protein